MKALAKNITGSPKTTAFGILSGLSIILLQVAHVLDEDPTTIFSLERFIEALGLIGIGLFSRDADKSSEDHGIDTVERAMVYAEKHSK